MKGKKKQEPEMAFQQQSDKQSKGGAQQEHTQRGVIEWQGGHSAKRPDWACLPNHFPVSVSQKEKQICQFCSSTLYFALSQRDY
jgi:hypothetical protein